MRRFKYLILIIITFILPLNIYADELDEYTIKTTFDADFNNIEHAPLYLSLRDKLIISTLNDYDSNSLDNEKIYDVNLVKLEEINNKIGFDILDGKRKVKIIKYDVINNISNTLVIDLTDINKFLDSTYFSFDIIDDLVTNNKLMINNLSNTTYEFINSSNNKKLFSIDNFNLTGNSLFKINVYDDLSSTDNMEIDVSDLGFINGMNGFNKIKLYVSDTNISEEIPVAITNPKTSRNTFLYVISIL